MKTLLPSIVVLAAAFATATSAQAQVTFGPRIGLNASSISQDIPDADEELDTKLLLGPQIGVTLNAQFGNISVQPSLLFSRKGYKVEEEDDDFKYEAWSRLSYVEIPVNFVYTTGGTAGFQVFAGPYVGVGIGGKEKYEYSEGTMSESGEDKVKFAGKEGDADDTEYYRSLDFGLNAGIGYKAGPIQAQLGYGLGLSNIVPNDEDDKEPEYKFKNRTLHLSLSYFFGE